MTDIKKGMGLVGVDGKYKHVYLTVSNNVDINSSEG